MDAECHSGGTSALRRLQPPPPASPGLSQILLSAFTEHWLPVVFFSAFRVEGCRVRGLLWGCRGATTHDPHSHLPMVPHPGSRLHGAALTLCTCRAS